jgi:hypothetical protein
VGVSQAAQGSEPELLIPISVVFTQVSTPDPAKNGITSMTIPQLVLCGDPQQRTPASSIIKSISPIFLYQLGRLSLPEKQE